jgi:large subunit ribosomal protein L22
MNVKASLNFARVGCQKARLVADVIRGKDVNQALRALTFMEKKSAGLFKKLLESAVANAEQKNVIDVDNLFVKTIYVDMGPSIKRFRPRAQGRAFMVRKKMSHIHLVLGEK